jgi:LPXTG-site transpeptidase (sortase) family protein
MRVGLFWRVLPFYVCVGLVFAIPLMQRQAAALQAKQQASLAQTRLDAAARRERTPLISGTPTRILIPTVGIDLKVVPGNYVASQATWTVSDTLANYALNSATLNNKAGKTLIYAHANKRVFGPTADLKTGDKVYVFSDNGHVFEYVFVSKVVVQPTEVEVLESLEGKPGLVLLSCDGSWYQNRRLMYLHLVRAT